ncbi:Outer membrane protein A precursor [hydrothermal vent metagenome]|uniref:Outer membrane protein A n=1 Tax=hydrothermal vent metagenome TaxID=652676 RepID=A0A3B0YGN3_9ZZZZ
MKQVRNGIIAVLALTLAACAADDRIRRAKTGAAIGAIAGAIIGQQVSGGKKGALAGAAIGAIAGGATGNYMDEQQRAFESELAEEQRRSDIEIHRLQDESLKIDVSSEVSFDFNSASLKPGFLPTLDKVSGILGRYTSTMVTVVGHTDSVGSESYNQALSERRARSVMNYMMDRGINPARLSAVGRGESQPRTSNATEAGRQLNRRVEILIRPVESNSANNQPAHGYSSGAPHGGAPSQPPPHDTYNEPVSAPSGQSDHSVGH